MNLSNELPPESNSSEYLSFNGTVRNTGFDMSSVAYIISIFLGLPTNSYVMWLIAVGAGNGLAAEIFTLNLCICEIYFCLNSVLSTLSLNQFFWAVSFLQGLSITGRPLFQCLICVERYLAVVHPVTFLKFKPLRYRVVCCVVVWMAGFGSCVVVSVILMLSLLKVFFGIVAAQLFLFLFVQLFCCLAVLRALKQSGPGERGREREEENHMKRRAFNIILIITVSMVIVNIPYITTMIISIRLNRRNDVVSVLGYFFFAMGGLVQPLLFLRRVGKLSFTKSL